MLKKDDPERIKLQDERVKYWLGVGAQPTDRVMRLLDAKGLAKRTAPNNPEKAKPKKKAQERAAAAAEKAAKAAEARRRLRPANPPVESPNPPNAAPEGYRSGQHVHCKTVWLCWRKFKSVESVDENLHEIDILREEQCRLTEVP